MAAKILIVAGFKGGISKTTTAGAIAKLISYERRVLGIDLDMQANFSDMALKKDIYALIQQQIIKGTIADAILEKDATGYPFPAGPNFDVIVSSIKLNEIDDMLAKLPEGEQHGILADTIAPLREKYDWIIIDLPPRLSKLTTSAFAIADFVLIPYEPCRFNESGLDQLFYVLAEVQEKLNPELEVIGILPAKVEARRLDMQFMIERLKKHELYGEYVLEDMIPRKATTGRLGQLGLDEESNPELSSACEAYIPVAARVLAYE